MKNANFILFCFVAWASLISCDRELDPEGHNETQQLVSVDGKVDGYDYVDLGLSVNWATCNVGASKPADRGSYFAWGETETRDSFSYESYKFYDGDGKYSKYCLPTHSDPYKYGVPDGKYELDREDDAARVKWGDGWRMPSYGDICELVKNCSWEWSDDFKSTGAPGWIGTSKKNGKTIFLPYAEINARDEDRALVSEYGCGYWSSSITYGSDVAQALHLNSDEIEAMEVRVRRNMGLLVRPIVDNVCEVNFYAVTPYDTVFIETDYVKAGQSVSAPHLPKIDGYVFVEWSESFPTVTADMNIYARFVDPPKEKLSVSGSANGYDYVDLGLSVKWATYNVGATKTTESGDYFAWGETAPKSEYSWDSYDWADQTNRYKMTKYYWGEEPSEPDITLEAEDDAANVNWGGAWRMPTMVECMELQEKCTWKWVENFNGRGMDGVLGVSQVNGNTILFPLAGVKGGNSRSREGCYWTANLFRGSSDLGFSFIFDSSPIIGDDPRWWGESVRPVISVE